MALPGRAFAYQHQHPHHPQHQHAHQQQQTHSEQSLISIEARRAAAVAGAAAGPAASAYPFEDNEDDDSSSSILDPAILDPENMHRQNPFRHRKDSFANSNGVLSPAESHTWDPHFANNGLTGDLNSGGNARFHDDNSNLFSNHQMSHQHNHFPSSSHQPLSANVWSVAHTSGDSTPTPSIDLMPPPSSFDAMQFTQQTRLDANPPPPFDHSRQHDPHAFPPPVDQPFIAPPQVQTPISPQSHQEWMALAQQEIDSRPMSRRMRPHSPPPVVDLRGRDGGIHKKNKRIDIPHERNIQTIDQMIENTKDEELLKELKAQKRLLRNREAALASRQRKKKHTEDLETKEKSYQTQISRLEQQIDALAIERDTYAHDRQILIHQTQENERLVEVVQMEKRDLIMKHTEETASLRKKVQVLSEQLEAVPAPAMSAAPSSAGYADFNADMEALSMIGPHEWDNFINVNDLHDDNADDFFFDQPHPQMASDSDQKPSATAMVPASNQPSTSDPATEPPIASGLLFMLLLCGAFVASKPAMSSTVSLPPLPPDVRAAAPTVLNSLLAESAAPAASHRPRTMLNKASGESAALHQLPPRSTHHNRLEHMHKHLTAPTKQQQVDSAFALTTSQYASLHPSDYPMPDQTHQPPQPRRTLAEALAEYHPSDASSKAEIYTRSLLMAQIPTNVVNQWREFLRGRSDLEMRDQS